MSDNSEENVVDSIYDLINVINKVYDIDRSLSAFNHEDFSHDFDTRRNSYGFDTYIIVNMKMDNCFSDYIDLISYDSSVKKLISNYPDKEDEIKERVKDWFESNDLFEFFIESERECLKNLLDTDYIRSSIEFLSRYLDESFEKGDTESVRKYSEKILKDSILLESLNAVDIDNERFIGRSGGYFAPLKDDFFESKLDNNSELRDNLLSYRTTLTDYLEKYDIFIEDDGIVFREEKVALSEIEADKVSEHLEDYIDSSVDFERYTNTIINEFDSINYDIESFNDSCLDIKKSKDAVSVILNFAEGCYKSANKQEYYLDFYSNEASYLDLIDDLSKEFKGIKEKDCGIKLKA